MRKYFAASLAAGLILSVGIPALAQSPEPGLMINSGGQYFDLSKAIIQDATNGNLFTLPTTSLALADGSIINIGFSGDKDPSLTYSFGATNNTPIPVTYTFDAYLPIIPTVSNSPLLASLFGSLTDGSSDGKVTITPAGGYTTLQQSEAYDASNLIHDLGLGVGPGTVAGGPGQNGLSFTYGPAVVNGTSTFVITALEVHLRFTLSGGGDSASFNGRLSVTGNPVESSVPEPNALAMLGAVGVCASGWGLRRRRSVRR